jgi:hypothetical protein
MIDEKTRSEKYHEFVLLRRPDLYSIGRNIPEVCGEIL